MRYEHPVRAIIVDEVNAPMMAKNALMDLSKNLLRPSAPVPSRVAVGKSASVFRTIFSGACENRE
jgi:hypothetical protein